ncbi:MAG: hypothetical protein Q4E65_03590 [Clostridia bacterium]|nr:hypothetical protein [Clostridia bacterium]
MRQLLLIIIIMQISQKIHIIPHFSKLLSKLRRFWRNIPLPGGVARRPQFFELFQFLV